MRAVRGEYAVESSKVDPRLRHQRDKPGDEVQRLENDVRGAIAVRRFELVAQQKPNGTMPTYRTRPLRQYLPLSIETDLLHHA